MPVVAEFDFIPDLTSSGRHSSTSVPEDPLNGSCSSKDLRRSQSYSLQAAPTAPLKSIDELLRTLELMHDRFIARNLRAAGLGGVDPVDDEKIYGKLDANANMLTGQSLLMAVLTNVDDPDKQVRVHKRTV